MGIDGVTFIAQIINLFVLIWLMKRFLYRPILEAVEKRRRFIASQIEEAEQLLKESKQKHLQAQTEKESFQKQKERLLQEVQKNVQQQKQILEKELKTHRQTAENELNKQLKEQSQALRQKLMLKIGENAFQSLLKICKDFGVHPSTDKAIDLFVHSLKKLPLHQKKEFSNTLLKRNRIEIISPQKLSVFQKEKIKQELINLFKINQNIKFIFKTDSTIGLGFYLKSENFIAEWTLKGYFNELMESFHQSALEQSD